MLNFSEYINEVKKNGCNCWDGYKRVPGTEPCAPGSCVKESLEEGGLWANIHAKRKRIKNGSGERMRKPGSKGAPSDADFKAANEETIHVGYRNSRGIWKKTSTHTNYPDAKAAMHDLEKAGKKGVQHRYDNNGSIDPGMRTLSHEEYIAEGKDEKIAQLKKDHDTAVHWSKNETSPQKREAARQKAEKIKQHLKTQYKHVVEELSTDEQFDLIEETVEQLAAEHGIDSEAIWETLESVDDTELLEYAIDKKGHKSSTGGLTQKGVDAYNRKTGGNLQTAVTTPPSKLDPDSKAAKRRKSFCARMGGVKGPMKDDKGRPTRKALALRKWNC